MFYVYVLKSEVDNTIYTGYTSDLKRRIKEHNNKESQWTKMKGEFNLIYYEAYRSEKDAKYREKQLKRHAGAMTHLKKRITRSMKL